MSFKNQIVAVVTLGNSGGGAIHDYLLCRNDFKSPFQGEEFRAITDPYGLENLYNKLIDDFSLNNSSEAFYQFKKYCWYLQNLVSTKTNKFTYGENFYHLSLNYLNQIESLSYKGIPQFKSISLGFFEKNLFRFKKSFLGYKNHQHNFYKMKIPVDKKKFLYETRKYLAQLFKSNTKNIFKKNIILDQATNYWKPEIAFKYFENLKIIIVSRDPRSIYYSMKFRGSYAYPGYDLKKFVNWYKQIINKRTKLNKKYKSRIIEIKFEDFVKNFKKEKKRIEKFLNIKPQDVKNFNFEFTNNNMIKAKNHLSNYEKNI